MEQFVLLQQLQVLLLESDLMATQVSQILPLCVQQIPSSVNVVVTYFTFDLQLPTRISSSPDDRDNNSLRLITKLSLYSSMMGESDDFTWLTLNDLSMYHWMYLLNLFLISELSFKIHYKDCLSSHLA